MNKKLVNNIKLVLIKFLKNQDLTNKKALISSLDTLNCFEKKCTFVYFIKLSKRFSNYNFLLILNLIVAAKNI